MADLSQYDPIIAAAANEWGQDPTMLKALILQESSGNPGAVSSAGARGLTQIMPETAKALGITDPADTTQQIFGAAKYLAQGHAAEGTPEGALLYYHGGPNWRQNYGPESAGYVPAVAARYTALTAASPNTSTVSTQSAPSGAQAAPAVPSDADFLKMVGTPSAAAPGAPAAPAVPSDAEFLKGAGGAPGPAAPAEPEPSGFYDDFGRPIGLESGPTPEGKAEAAAFGNIASAALEGAKEGFGSGPLGLSDAQTAALQRAGIFNKPGEAGALRSVNEAGINALAAAGDLILRGGNALVGAYQHGVAQAGTEIGAPQLGRDLAALPEAFPTGDLGGGTRIAGPSGAPASSDNRLAISPAAHAVLDTYDPPLTAQFRDNPFAPGFSGQPNRMAAGATIKLGDKTIELPPRPDAPAPPAPVSANPYVAPPAEGTTITVVPDGTPGTQSVGAAASRDMSSPGSYELTPAQAQANRSVAEGQKLNEPQPVGPDTRRYVDDVEPTAAHMEQSANVSREQKMVESAIPEEFKAIASANNEARQRYFENIAGSDVTVMNAIAARSEQAERDLAAAWQNKTEADPQPVIDAANQVKASPDGRRPIVRNAVDSVTRELTDSDGAMITDPEQLYGVRKHIDDLMSKEASADDPKSVRALSSLQQLKTALDGVIEQAAPGFKQYLQNFSDASRPIDEMQVLQKHENKLYDTQGRMQLSRVQNMMRNIVESRAAPGINPYKSISDETMDQLWNLRDDLRRVAASDELARAKGSDTAQNLMDAAKAMGKVAITGAAHSVANSVAPVAGSFVVHGVQKVIGASREKRAQLRLQRRANELARPDPSKYPPPTD